MTRQDLRIPAHGEQIAAYLYRPQVSGGDVPCVVMAHGFTGTRDDGLAEYAEAFCEAGCAVVLFDYRCFGASSGEPRQLLDIAEQHRDYHAVIAWARRLDGIDPDRIVVWGSSFSGGHVLAVAAQDPRIAAVIAQAPFTDAVASLREVPLRTVPRILAAAVRDQAGAWRGRPPRTVAAVGAPGTVAAMTSPDAKVGFEAILGPNSLWRNEFAARLMLRFPFYRPGRKTAKLHMPVLLCVCDEDVVTPPGPSVTAVHRAPHGQLRRYPYGHFDIYHDPRAKADQVAFLRRVLGPQLADGPS
ncbi:alpha/beta hydrolase [Mycolicibacterium duvalii]|uniref:Alpha/beta hydrolase n=1 Tax=Mycolicibacterium duvalii TaxID=39688 RepID=A0A7I7JZJ5_9MYCO|nr:alpha/beta fold hydrolase [Mycolicibacterium duvalii]MCV7367334.1 alpha/beta hydrolase [Mycolicibacterium duvalii]PEG43512.1 alpha/beta hydrolase [Mycolicibacterium duvalii]BBX17296.1 alpha/beta hydrolase [Mycolicibacterium duvalii]